MDIIVHATTPTRGDYLVKVVGFPDYQMALYPDKHKQALRRALVRGKAYGRKGHLARSTAAIVDAATATKLHAEGIPWAHPILWR